MPSSNTSIDAYVADKFGVDNNVFIEALRSSPSAIGYIFGAISEVCLKRQLEAKGYEVIRIKEKPSGGNNAKSADARGDFYIRPKGSAEDKWLVVESKGLKSNSEFRGSKLDSKDKVFRFLKTRAFNEDRTAECIYAKGLSSYKRTKAAWESSHPDKSFPGFSWSKSHPGPDSLDLNGVWQSVAELKEWVDKFSDEAFSEKSYRTAQGPIAILETHQPSKRVGPITGISQAAPLVLDFNIMSVDLYLRTGKHEFVFMNAEDISHSPTSPEHLYQNYTIDILVKDRKDRPIITPPWYKDIDQCITATGPSYRKMDTSQVDDR